MLDPTSKIKNLCISIEAISRVPGTESHLYVLNSLLADTMSLEKEDIKTEIKRRQDYKDNYTSPDDTPAF